MDINAKNLKLDLLKKDKWNKILNLSVSKSQKTFIETSQRCLDDAMTNAYNMEWNFYGIYVGNNLIGFAMHGLQYLKNSENTRLWLDRFMIDEKFQGNGYGKKSFVLIIDKLMHDYNCNEIYLSVHDDNFLAIKMYEKAGFKKTQRVDPNGEIVMIYNK